MKPLAGLVLADIQFPVHNQVLLTVVERYMATRSWDFLVYLGDIMDMDAISHFAISEGNARALENKRLKKDYAEMTKILRRHRKIVGPKCKTYFLMGNHEEWAEKFVDKYPMLEGFLEAAFNLPFGELGIEVIPPRHYTKIGKLHFIHGDINTGNYSSIHHAKKVVETYNRNVVYGHHHCFDDQTELLTKRGWLKYQDITAQDEALTMNRATGLLEWNDVQGVYVYDHDGPMVRIRSVGLDLLVDEEHGMVFKDYRDGQFRFDTAKTMLARPNANTTFKVSGSIDLPDYPMSDEILRVLAWVISEGNVYQKGNTPYVDISQSKWDGIERISSVLEDADMFFQLVEKRPTSISKLVPYRFRLDVDAAEDIVHFLPDKTHVPSWFHLLSPRQFNIFLDEYIKGDGTVYSDKNIRLLYTNNKEWVDAFQAKLFQHGFKSKVYWRTNGSFPFTKPVAQVVIQPTEYHEVKRNRMTIVRYKGKKWCASVPNRTLVVRRNHKPVITQNTLQVFTKISPVGIEETHSAYCIPALANTQPIWAKDKPNAWLNGFGVFFITADRFSVIPVVAVRNGFIAPDGREYEP